MCKPSRSSGLLLGAASAAFIALDELGHPQQMWIMNVVWPITGLYAGPFALWGYFTAGRLSTKSAVMEAKVRKGWRSQLSRFLTMK